MVSALWGWESSIVYRDGGGRLVYESDERGNRLADFSHAGYRSGEGEMPRRPVVRTIEPVAGDNTAHIQAAIDEVAALPLASRGAILLKQGRYEVSGIVYLHSEGIVLRGEGNGAAATNTHVVGTGTNQRKEQGIILVKAKTGGNKIEPGTLQNIVSEYLPMGSRTIEVEDGSKYREGDHLVIRHDATKAWLEAINYGNVYGDEAVWVEGQTDLRMFFHGTVTAISGNKVKLDTPLYHPLDRSLSQAVVYRHSGLGLVKECGVENMRVISENTGGTDEAHSWDCVHFIGARNCWARNVISVGFAESGFRFTETTRTTVQNCQAIDPVSRIEGGRRYNFYIDRDSHDVLVKNSLATKGRHCFVGNGAAGVSGVVFTQSESRNAYSTSENHRRWGSGFLWDAIEWTAASTNTVLALYNRGNAGTSHGWTGTGLVAWNITAPGKNLVCSEPPLGQNYAIGCTANVVGGNYPRGFVEGTGQTPSIPSLYEAQLAERLTYGVGPCAPARLKASHYSNTGAPFVALEWNDLALDETSYVLERSANGGSSFAVVATLPADTEHFTDITVTRGGRYVYRLKATNAIGASAYGNPVTVWLATNELPEAVTIQAEDFISQSGATVRWNRHGFTGFGYVDIAGAATWIELQVDGGMGGLTPMVFRYGAGETIDRPCAILVNGSQVATGTFKSTGSWEAWTTETVMVPLAPGLNTVRIQPNAGVNGPNFDKVEVYATPPIYAAGEAVDAGAEKAFDTNAQTLWKHYSPRGSWIQIADSGSLEVSEYLMSAGSGAQANDPKDWTFLGSNDGGATWTTLDTRTGVLFSERGESRIFKVTDAGKYRLYRWNITAVRDVAAADSVQIAELQLVYGNRPPLTPNPAAFAVAPYAISESAVSMTAVVGSSAIGTVEYYFDEVSGNAGGTDSGWITTPEYTDGGLTAGTEYRYVVTMRDFPGNETAPSAVMSVRPLGQVTTVWSASEGSDGLWTTASNWTGEGAAPLTVAQFKKVVFSALGTKACLLDTTATVAQLVMGEGGEDTGNALHLVAGAQLTAGLKPNESTNWTAIGYDRGATLTVASGAHLKTVSNLWVGYAAPAVGTLVVDGGTVEVQGILGLGRNLGVGIVDIRNGGTVHCLSLSIRANSRLNLDDGSLVLDGDKVALVQTHISAGQITAYNGSGELVVLHDAAANRTTVTTAAFGYDQWSSALGAAIGGTQQDYDGDQRSNLFEYALNGNPLDPEQPGTDPVLKTADGAVYFVHLRRTNDPHLEYRVEVNPSLSAGGWVSAAFTEVYTREVPGSESFVEVWTLIPADTPHAFIRLRITNP